MILPAFLLLLQVAGAAPEFEKAKAESTPAELYALLWATPKGGDLHHHLGLSYLPEDLYRAATDSRITGGVRFYTRVRDSGCPDDPLPAVRWINAPDFQWRTFTECVRGDFVPLGALSADQRSEWLSSLVVDRAGENKNEFFERIVPRMIGLVRHAPLSLHLTAEMLKRYRREGILYLESNAGLLKFWDTTGALHPPERGVAMLRERLQQPDLEREGIPLRLQATAIRFAPDAEEQVRQAYRFVDAHRDLYVGVNIAGREDNDDGHPSRLLDVFREMRRRYSGIRLSLHGGEKASPGGEVRQTMLLGAERVGHGLNLISDPDGMLLLRRGHTLIEVNLISNRLLGYVPELDRHPFPEYLRTGIPVCLNTDDPGAWDSNLTDEYFTAVRHFHLTWDEIVRLGRNSLEYSFAEPPLKQRLLAQYEENVRRFTARLEKEGWRAVARSARPEVSGYARRTWQLSQ